MLEQDGKLLTWQVPLPPEQWGEEQIACAKIFDHRLKYLDYQGQISGNRGVVKRAHDGEYVEQSKSPGHVEITLCIKRTSCMIRLEQIRDENWILSSRDSD
jgi:hypothetical protein